MSLRIALVTGAPLEDRSEIGAAYHTRELAAELLKAGLTVEIWSKSGAGQAAASSVPIVPLWRPGWLAWLDIFKAVRERKPDVLHVQYSTFVLGAGAAGEIAMLALLVLLKLNGTNVVITVHDVPSLTQITPEYIRMNGYKFPAAVVRLGLRLIFLAISFTARSIVVHQEAFATILARDYGIDRRKIAVVPLIAPAHRTVGRAAARTALGMSASEKVALFFGFATRYKGIELLLAAAEQLGAPFQLRVLLGAGEHPKVAHTVEYDAYYSALKRRAGSIAGVEFLGFLPDARLDEYVEAADVAVFPYIEAQSMSGPLTICAAHGIPVLVSTRIAEKVPGLAPCAFDPSASALAAALTRFFGDPSYRAAVEAQSRTFAQQHVRSGETVAQTIALYRAAASTSRTRS
jgi:glycosyltransferase involved in cell wall biosynthesis